VETARVAHEGGTYRIDLTIRIKGRKDTIREIVTRYGEVARLSDVISESGIIDTGESGALRRFYVTDTCILFFCFRVAVVEDIIEYREGYFRTEYIPELSDFSFGFTEWWIRPVNASHTEMRIAGEFRPAFWIPPVIGPYLIKRRMLSAAKQTIKQIERMAVNEEVRR